MDRVLYVAMTGAQQTMRAQTVNAQNLANVNVTGFRADLASFVESPVPGPGLPSRVNTLAQGQGVNFQAGEIMTTGRDLDVAINGEGWLAVESPSGDEAYTRSGHLEVSPNGLLMSAGHPVIGNGGGPISIPPAEKVEIGADGTVSIRPVGEAANTLVTIDRLKLVRHEPGAIDKGEDGLMHRIDGATGEADASVTLTSGALEGSNVNAVDALVEMIGLSRQFEMQIKIMKTAEENDQASAGLLGIN